MKRLTESQLRQVIREELVGLLNEISPFERGPIYGSPRKQPVIDTEVEVSEAGSELGEKEELLSVTGAQIINLFPKFKEMIQKKQANLIPLPLREFLIDYEFDLDDYSNQIKIAKDDEKKKLATQRLQTYISEMRTKKVIVFYYNHANRYDKGYTIEVFPLSIKRAEKGQQFSSEAHEMRKISGPTLDRSEIQKYENVLNIKVPEPTNPQNLTSTQSSRSQQASLGPVSQDAGMDALRARIGGQQYGTLALDKGMRENKKRNR